MDTSRPSARALPFALPLLLGLLLGAAAPAAASEPSPAGDKDKDKDETEYDYGAKVSIELRQENGKVVKHRGELRSFGNEWRFEFEGEGHQHLVTLNAESEEGSKTLEVTLAYERDGSPIIAPFTDTYTARKRQAVWTDNGDFAVALTLTPTKFPRQTTQRDDKQQIKPDDSDDPLGGGGLLK
jgi:hypothetical protein